MRELRGLGCVIGSRQATNVGSVGGRSPKSPPTASTPLDLDSRRICAFGQRGFHASHLRGYSADRAGRAMGPARGVDPIACGLDAGRVAAWAAGLVHPMLSPRRRWLPGPDLRRRTASIEALDRRGRKAAEAQRGVLRGRGRIPLVTKTITGRPARDRSQARNRQRDCAGDDGVVKRSRRALSSVRSPPNDA